MTISIVYDFQTKFSKNIKKLIPDEERDLLAVYLKHFGIEPKSIFFTFAYPIEATKIDRRVAEEARHKLLKELKEKQVTKILCCGTIAYGILSGQYNYLNVANTWGTAFEIEGMYGVVAPSPSLILEIKQSTTGKKSQPNVDRVRDFEICLEKLTKYDHVKPLPDYDFTVIDSFEELETELKYIIDNPGLSPIVVDTETTGLDAIHNSLLCLGLGYFYQGKTIDNKKCGNMLVIPGEILYRPDTVELLKKFFSGQSFTGSFVFHNAKFDIKFLTIYLGISFKPDMVQDTILLSYLLDERPIGWFGKSSHGLKSQSRIWFDGPDYAFNFEKFYATPEDKRDYLSLYSYLSLDLVYTRGLFDLLTAKINEEDQDLFRPYSTLLIPATCALAEIELKGAMVDKEYLKKLKKDFEEQIAEKLANLIKIVGSENFNPNSHQQVKKAIEKLSGGSLIPISSDKANLEDFQDNSGIPEVSYFCSELLAYRGLAKALSTYIIALLENADENGRIHADFNVNGTSSGRLSSSNPNLQNIPFNMGPAIRKSFCAPEDKIFVTADFSQLELRTAAWLSQDKNFLEAFKTGKDIHREFASKIYGIPYDKVDALTRKKGKTLVFGMLYGRSAWAISNELGIDREEAEQLIHSLLDNFPGFGEWSDQIKQDIIDNQFIKTMTGRKRRWPLITQFNHNAVVREAVNNPIQSAASDICLTALIDLHSELKKYNSFITFTVHDSLEIEADKKYINEVVELVRDRMVSSYSNEDIIFEVDIDAGPNWADSKKVE